jgi:hypothetical protein
MKPAYLLFFIWLITRKHGFRSILGKSILFVGDSVDRGIVYRWCEHFNQTVGDKDLVFETWGDPALQYDAGHRMERPERLSPSICQFENDSMASLHHYGSKPKGPYFSNYFQTVENLIIESDRRIEIGIKNYLSEFGVPGAIYYNSILWDYQATAEGKYSRELDFEKFTMERLNQIYSLIKHIDPPIPIGLRTAPSSTDNRKSIHFFNKIYRDIFQSRKLPYLKLFYDYDDDLWSSIQFEFDRTVVDNFYTPPDRQHPNYHYAWRAGEKLLGKQYSEYLLNHKDQENTSYSSKEHIEEKEVEWLSSRHQSRLISSIYSNHSQLIRNLFVIRYQDNNNEEQEEQEGTGTPRNSIYQYINLFDSSLPEDSKGNLYENLFLSLDFQSNQSVPIQTNWYGPFTYSILKHLYLSPGSILPRAVSSSSSSMAGVTVKRLPIFLRQTEKEYLIETKSGKQYWIFENLLIYIIPTKEIWQILIERRMKIQIHEIIRGLDDFWFTNILEPSHIKDVIPESIYQVGALIRVYNEKQIYYVDMNLILRPVNSVNVFFAHGWDFSQVQGVLVRRFLDLFDVGSPMV